jgi:hypothetical protein
MRNISRALAQLPSGFSQLIPLIVLLALFAVCFNFLFGYFAERKERLKQQTFNTERFSELLSPTSSIRQGAGSEEWEEYRNAHFGFSIKYLSNMERNTINFTTGIPTAKLNSVFVLSGARHTSSQRSNVQLLFAVSVDENMHRLTLREFARYTQAEAKENLKAAYGDVQEYRDMTPTVTMTRINGLDAFHLAGHNIYGTQETLIQHPVSRKIVILSYQTARSNSTRYQNVVDEMLQSFRFTE